MILYALNFGAGILTALSPCVLPAIPLVVGSAAQQNKFAPIAIAGGLVASFTILGVLVAAFGFSVGIDADIIRKIAAILMILFGVALAVAQLQWVSQKLLGPAANLANGWIGEVHGGGLLKYFGMGLLLGAVWSPCVGPTLGAAVTLASQSGGLTEASLMMLVYGVGSALPLVGIAYGSRSVFQTYRSRLLKFGQYSKSVLGGLCILVGSLVLSGSDKRIESFLLEVLPQSWVNLITIL